MPCRCIVYGCRGNYSDGPKVSLFSFPSSEEMKKKWLKVLPLKHDTISKNTKVCQLHFNDSDFIKEVEAYDSKSGETVRYKLENIRLKKDVVPSRFSEYLNVDSENFKGYVKKHFLNSEISNIRRLKKEGKEDPDWENYIKSVREMTEKVEPKYTRQLNSWERDEMSALIALYELEPCLYDKKDPKYYSHEEKNEAYRRIQQVMINIRPNCTVPQIKSKIQKVRCQLSKEKRWKKICINKGYCTEETFESSLWCFRLLHFLDEHTNLQERCKMKISAVQCESSKDSSEGNKQYENMLFNCESIQNGKFESSKESFILDKQYENMLSNPGNVQNGKNKKSKESEDERNKQCEDLLADSIDDCQEYQDEVEFPCTADESQEDCNYINKEVNNRKRKRNDVVSPSNKVNSHENVLICNPDKEDIFGQYVAEEMKALREKPFLYAKTKQSILQILTKSNFEIQNFVCS